MCGLKHRCGKHTLLILLSVLFLGLVSLPILAADGYLMSEAERAESLRLISDLKQDLENRKIQYESLKKVNAEIEQRLANSDQKIKDLEDSNNKREISLQELRQQKETIQKDLTDLNKLLKACQRQNRILRVIALGELILIILGG